MSEINVLLANDDGSLLTDDGGAALVAYVLQLGPPVPAFSAGDFTDAVLNLLPSGPVWPKEPGSVQAQVAAGLAPSCVRLTARAAALLNDAPVGTCVERLPEWEATLGLPDPCAGASPTLQQRQRSIDAAIAARGGQSIPYALSLLTALGRSGTAIEYAPARVDLWSPEMPLYGPEWAYAWEIVVDAIQDGSEDLVATDAVVRCNLERMCPAHTKLLLSFVNYDYSPDDFSSDFSGGQS